MPWAWLAYAGASAAILVSGARLCRLADTLAARRGWTRGWVGLVLLATVTSVPELVTGISSVTLADTPRIAIANVAGAIALNLALLGALGLVVAGMHGRGAHGPAAAHGIAMIALVCGIAVAGYTNQPWADAALWLLLPAYLLVMRDLHRRGAVVAVDPAAPFRTSVFVGHALVIVAAAMVLPYAAAAIADATGLGRTFVGGSFVAISTTLPEMAVTVAALRLRAPDLAIGNLFGSNLIDVAILGLDELLYPGSLAATVEVGHIGLFGGALVMAVLAWSMVGALRASTKFVGAALLLCYAGVQALVLAQ